MAIIRTGVLGLAVSLLAVSTAWAQLGQGPSQTFESRLPTNAINMTMGNFGYTSGSQFMPNSGGANTSPLYVGMDVSLFQDLSRSSNWNALGTGPGFGPLVPLRVQTLDSLNFDKRARFAKLRETTVALAERIRQADEASFGQVSINFRHFMFPLSLVNQPELGYGFFTRMDLVGAGSVNPEAFLAPFTAEVQQSLGEKKFLDATQERLLGRPLPQGMALDQFYDTQLAALADFLFNNGRYVAASEAWAVLVQRDATNASASRGLALSLLAGGQLKKAAVEARRSLTLMPGWPDKLKIVGSNLQDVFPNVKDLTSLRDELTAQLAKQPDDADLNFAMAFVDVFQGNVSAAEERLGKIADRDNVAKRLQGFLQSGAVADTVKRPAQSALRRAAEEMAMVEGRPMTPEARGQLITAIQSGATTFEDKMRLGDFRFFLGDFAQAGEVYRAAHKARPEDPFALFAMAHTCYANGEYKMAVKYLESALALEPNWGLYEFRIQEFYGDRGEYQRHLKDLERQVELRPHAVEMKFLLAYVYYFSGRYADATDLLAEIVRMDPKFERANYFLRLARLQG